MPIIDGEKYACTSCIKGHRVSGCTHTERELHHINPKGRPVKQCEHCRGARKSKAHHVKCDCGERKDKDRLKDKGDAKGENTTGISVAEVSNLAAADDNRCCCHTGAKCICGIKKEPLDLKLDTGKQTLHGARAKPKLNTAHSESTLTVFANGHHKPCHRNNNSAHVSGMPYKIPRPHSLHGSAAFASYSSNSACGLSDASVQRAMDTHSLSNNDYYTMLGSPQRSLDSLPITPLTSSLDNSGVQDSLFNTQPSAFAQEGDSPESQSSDALPSQQWSWTSSITPLTRNFAYGSLSTSPSQDCLPNLDNDWAIPSAGLNPVWSAGDLPLDPNKLSNSVTQPISHSGESKQSAPGLTTASSAQSEMGEPTLFGDLDFRNPQSAVSESLFWEDSPVYRSATSGPIEPRAAPTSVPGTAASNSSSLEFDFSDRTNEGSPFKTNLDFASDPLAFSSVGVGAIQAAKDLSSVPISIPSTLDYDEPRALAMPNSMDDIVSNDPWMLDQNNIFVGLGTFEGAYPNWS